MANSTNVTLLGDNLDAYVISGWVNSLGVTVCLAMLTIGSLLIAGIIDYERNLQQKTLINMINSLMWFQTLLTVGFQSIVFILQSTFGPLSSILCAMKVMDRHILPPTWCSVSTNSWH